LDHVVEPLLKKVEDELARPKQLGMIKKPRALRTTQVIGALEELGYTFEEAYTLFLSIEQQRRVPTSRKTFRLRRAEEELRRAGIDPETLLPLEGDHSSVAR
jgi:hypothetical protein